MTHVRTKEVLLWIFCCQTVLRRYGLHEVITRLVPLACPAQLPEFTGEKYCFRTSAHLHRICVLLEIPARCGPFSNDSYEDSEKLFLFFLRRMASVGTLSDLADELGSEKAE
jgi:hypothetical protein